jgi:membrane associated rhomboid family serine protease
MPIKVHYNAPVVLTFTIISVVIFALDHWILQRWITKTFLILPGIWTWSNPLDYVRLFLYPMGHADRDHLIGNFSLFLLIAPIMEEKYGSENVAKMMVLTTLITGVLQILIFNSGLLGASGLVFMFIVLASFADVRQGSIPLTFILVIFFFLGKEALNAVSKDDNTSQYAHIMGGIMGGFFGFSLKEAKMK